MNEAEIKAQQDAARIVQLTNPFDFDFTHAWGGTPYTLPAGKSMMFPYPLADHLATHLARYSLIRKAPRRDESEVDGKGKDRPLWSEESIAEIKKSLMKELYTEEVKPKLDEAEIMRRKIEELNRDFAKLMGSAEPSNVVAPPSTEATAAPVQVTDSATVAPSGPVVYQDKAQVIAELAKRGVKFDARKNKSELEKLLTA